MKKFSAPLGYKKDGTFELFSRELLFEYLSVLSASTVAKMSWKFTPKVCVLPSATRRCTPRLWSHGKSPAEGPIELLTARPPVRSGESCHKGVSVSPQTSHKNNGRRAHFPWARDRWVRDAAQGGASTAQSSSRSRHFACVPAHECGRLTRTDLLITT